jgi:leader peptidase (prepilin peptidase) / N-methyltransferase
MAASLIVAGVFGGALGSFAGALAHRLPRRESMGGRSRCPACGARIRAYDNVPIVSWLLLRGRCRDCGASISPRYALAEVVTASLFVAVVAVKGTGPDAWLGLALVALLVPVALIDLEHRIIPNRLLLPAVAAGAALTAVADAGDLGEHAAAGAGAFAFLLVAALAYPAGMGMGDVKLAGVLGLFLGVSIVPAMLVAFLAGTLVGLAVIAREGPKARKKGVPFGPFLAIGGVVGLLAGPELIDLYADRFLS